jgi:hypothetical protein
MEGTVAVLAVCCGQNGAVVTRPDKPATGSVTVNEELS